MCIRDSFIVVVDLLMEPPPSLFPKSGDLSYDGDLTGLYLVREIVNLDILSEKQLSRFCFYTSFGGGDIIREVEEFSKPFGMDIYKKSIGDPSHLCIPMINKLDE